jgi:DNA repair protein RadD
MKDSGFDRNRTVEGFKDGKYQCVVNVNILTTGFDEPGIDLIAMLRPTQSPVLHVQSLGRGSRVQEDKDNCLVLDFAGNTARLGPINNVLVKVKGKAGEGGDPITKTCPDCDEILPPAVKLCPVCSHEFLFRHNISETAFDIDVIEDGRARWCPVDSVSYDKAVKFGNPTTVKVTYHIGGRSVSEWVCLEHKGFAKHKADHWVKFRGGLPCSTADDLLLQQSKIKVPDEILVERKGKYHVIKDANFPVISN